MMASMSMELERSEEGRSRKESADRENSSEKRRVDAIIFLVIVVLVALFWAIVFGVMKKGSTDVGSSELTRWTPQGGDSSDG